MALAGFWTGAKKEVGRKTWNSWCFFGEESQCKECWVVRRSCKNQPFLLVFGDERQRRNGENTVGILSHEKQVRPLMFCQGL